MFIYYCSVIELHMQWMISSHILKYFNITNDLNDNIEEEVDEAKNEQRTDADFRTPETLREPIRKKRPKFYNENELSNMANDAIGFHMFLPNKFVKK